MNGLLQMFIKRHGLPPEWTPAHRETTRQFPLLYQVSSAWYRVIDACPLSMATQPDSGAT